MEKIENYNIEYFCNGKPLDSILIIDELKDYLENCIINSLNRGQLSGSCTLNIKSEGNTHSMDIILFRLTKKNDNQR